MEFGPSVVETFSPARDEIQSDQPTTATEFVEVMIQFGLISMFGAVWPLTAGRLLRTNKHSAALNVLSSSSRRLTV